MIHGAKALACALALCMSMVVLPACSNNGIGTAQDGAAAEQLVVTKKTFLGDWTVIKAQADGISMSGVLSSMGLNFGVNFAEDGTFTMGIGESSFSGTWEFSDNTAVLSFDDADSVGMDSMTVSVEDENTLSGVTTISDKQTTLTFAKGADVGTYLEYDPAEAQPITDSSQLIGTWHIRAVDVFGMCVSGDFANLDESQLSGVESFKDYGISFNGDGTGNFTQNGKSDDSAWQTSSSGTTLTSNGMTLELKMVNDCIMLDVDAMLESLLGSDSNMEVYLFLSKA